jgi:hypothetical protein
VSAITPPPPRGWVVVQDGRLVGRDAELLVHVRGGWVPAIVDDGRRVGATRNRRSIDVIYPLDVPRWQRTGGRLSVDRIAVREEVVQ